MIKIPIPDFSPILDRNNKIDPKHIMLKESVTYIIELDGWEYHIFIRKGYIFDGASIPRILWRIGTPFDPHTLPAALPHDGLYQSELVTRATADKILLFVLYQCGVNVVKCRLYYQGVRLGGWKTWKFEHTLQTVTYARNFVNVSKIRLALEKGNEE